MILREAMAERLPTSVLFDMKRAFGTTVPYGEWLRSEWHRLFDRNAIAATGLFDVKKIDLMVQHDLKMELIPVHMLLTCLPFRVGVPSFNHRHRNTLEAAIPAGACRKVVFEVDGSTWHIESR